MYGDAEKPGGKGAGGVSDGGIAEPACQHGVLAVVGDADLQGCIRAGGCHAKDIQPELAKGLAGKGLGQGGGCQEAFRVCRGVRAQGDHGYVQDDGFVINFTVEVEGGNTLGFRWDALEAHGVAQGLGGIGQGKGTGAAAVLARSQQPVCCGLQECALGEKSIAPLYSECMAVFGEEVEMNRCVRVRCADLA